MSKARRKFYVVWQGYSPGIYDSWTECQQQTVNYPGAKFKSFDSLEEANAAYRGNPEGQLDLVRAIASALPGMEAFTGRLSRPKSGIAVDGACAGNPGVMEYRGVDIASGRELFRIGSAGNLIGTNNIAEYLAIVHVAALLKKAGDTTTTIYSDSRTAQSWVRKGAARSTLEYAPATAATKALIDRADLWLHNNRIMNPIVKWDTEAWGEIPADFGRK